MINRLTLGLSSCRPPLTRVLTANCTPRPWPTTRYTLVAFWSIPLRTHTSCLAASVALVVHVCSGRACVRACLVVAMTVRAGYPQVLVLMFWMYLDSEDLSTVNKGNTVPPSVFFFKTILRLHFFTIIAFGEISFWAETCLTILTPRTCFYICFIFKLSIKSPPPTFF